MEQKTKKILITTGIVGVLSLVAYKLLAKRNSTLNPNLDLPKIDGGTETPNPNEAPPIEDISIYTNTEIAEMKAAQEKAASISKYTSEELADLLQLDFNGNGTNWAAGSHGGVVGVLLQLNSDADFDNLNTAYGIRPIKAGLVKSLFEKPYVGDMNGAFNSELTKKEIAKVNDILSKKGITRRIVIETKLPA
jgi:hypothetical protein